MSPFLSNGHTLLSSLVGSLSVDGDVCSATVIPDDPFLSPFRARRRCLLVSNLWFVSPATRSTGCRSSYAGELRSDGCGSLINLNRTLRAPLTDPVARALSVCQGVRAVTKLIAVGISFPEVSVSPSLSHWALSVSSCAEVANGLRLIPSHTVFKT
ncbi:hypothetical protein B0J18DRAFT_150653 [Chaetomium sp. MPI-SDFR-AT-0129]|nr:hypothetical protein B0J18DRAFT_150653 [Chaetomium sp. MPI-SDFR-AT-0129]